MLHVLVCIGKESSAPNLTTKLQMNRAKTITLVILGPGPIALGVLLMETGTPPGVVGFAIFLPWTLIWSIIVVCYLFSLAFKLIRVRKSDSYDGTEKDEIKQQS